MRPSQTIFVLFSLLISVQALAQRTDGQPCFIVCRGGCRITQGPTYAESKVVYEETTRAEWLMIPWGRTPPKRPTTIEKLQDLQHEGICREPQSYEVGQCHINRVEGRRAIYFEISVDGANERMIYGTTRSDVETSIQAFEQLGQCHR